MANKFSLGYKELMLTKFKNQNTLIMRKKEFCISAIRPFSFNLQKCMRPTFFYRTNYKCTE